MTDEEERVLVCKRVDSEGPVYPGSRVYECDNCGAEVWIAPSGQASIVDFTATICIPCACTRFEKKAPDAVEILPAAAQEIRNWQGRN